MAVRELDPKKKVIIEHVDGPLLVIAGPGAGKTMAIVERVVEMYIGTMHSIFLRVLKDYAEFTRLKKTYKTFDDFDQKYSVYRNIYKRFMGIKNLEHVAAELSNWSKADSICRYVNKVREEAVDPEVRALGEVYQTYQQILVEENAIDFSAIQSEMLSLIENNPKVLAELQEKFRYLIIDEYQDT